MIPLYVLHSVSGQPVAYLELFIPRKGRGAKVVVVCFLVQLLVLIFTRPSYDSLGKPHVAFSC